MGNNNEGAEKDIGIFSSFERAKSVAEKLAREPLEWKEPWKYISFSEDKDWCWATGVEGVYFITEFDLDEIKP